MQSTKSFCCSRCADQLCRSSSKASPTEPDAQKREETHMPPPAPVLCTAAVFDAHAGGAFHLEQSGRRLTGLSGGAMCTATTNLILGNERLAIEFLMSKSCTFQRGYQVAFGVLSPGGDRSKMLGTQVGSVALNAAGALMVDYEMHRIGLGRILPGATVRLEWEPAYIRAPSPAYYGDTGSVGLLIWRVNDAAVCRWEADCRGWTVVAGSIGEGQIIEIAKPGRHIPPVRSSIAEALAAADE